MPMGRLAAVSLWCLALEAAAVSLEPVSGASSDAFLGPSEGAKAEAGGALAPQELLSYNVTAEAGMEAFYAEIDAYFAQAKPLWKQLVIPIAAIIAGLPAMRGSGAVNTVGKVLIFFGAQTFMNLYMKVVLSGSVVSRELHLKGYPAAFAVTALQQISSLFIIMAGIGALWFTPWRYVPTKIDTKFGWMTVLAFSVTFTLNISLNNFSLSLLPLSVNLIIRSCSPLSTYFAEMLMERVAGRTLQHSSTAEMMAMLLGIGAATLAVVGKAKISKQSADPEASANTLLGVMVCLASLASASLNMALAGLMGTSLKMNPIDTALYMAPFSSMFLLLPVMLMPHPTEWPGPMMTDWQITMKVAEHAPGVLGLAFLSGIFAVCYNILTYFFVQSLSATHAAFASNFNKAATIGIAVAVGLETIVLKGWGLVMAGGVAGNIIAFTAYSVIKAGGAAQGGKAHGARH